jgi:Uncharacterized protein conserved in bacteria (DUF2169)
VFTGDVETDLGILPNDLVPRTDPAFEVVVLGAAYAPGEEPVEKRLVSLNVGGVRREVLVHGDRRWEPGTDGPMIGAPLPFHRMPIIWQRAFGGSALVEIDREAFLELDHPMNRYGRGFDFTKLVEDTAHELRVPAGYPRWEPDLRLPNVEDPRDPIERRDQEPLPVCWSAVPLGIGVHVHRLIERHRSGEPATSLATALDEARHRAHPAWILDAPPRGEITLSGLCPGPDVVLPIPEWDVVLDVEVDGHGETHRALPQMLALLPEQQRMYLVYRHRFRVDPSKSSTSRLRVREVANSP